MIKGFSAKKKSKPKKVCSNCNSSKLDENEDGQVICLTCGLVLALGDQQVVESSLIVRTTGGGVITRSKGKKRTRTKDLAKEAKKSKKLTDDEYLSMLQFLMEFQNKQLLNDCGISCKNKTENTKALWFRYISKLKANKNINISMNYTFSGKQQVFDPTGDNLLVKNQDFPNPNLSITLAINFLTLRMCEAKKCPNCNCDCITLQDFLHLVQVGMVSYHNVYCKLPFQIQQNFTAYKFLLENNTIPNFKVMRKLVHLLEKFFTSDDPRPPSFYFVRHNFTVTARHLFRLELDVPNIVLRDLCSYLLIVTRVLRDDSLPVQPNVDSLACICLAIYLYLRQPQAPLREPPTCKAGSKYELQLVYSFSSPLDMEELTADKSRLRQYVAFVGDHIFSDCEVPTALKPFHEQLRSASGVESDALQTRTRWKEEAFRDLKVADAYSLTSLEEWRVSAIKSCSSSEICRDSLLDDLAKLYCLDRLLRDKHSLVARRARNLSAVLKDRISKSDNVLLLQPAVLDAQRLHALGPSLLYINQL